MASQEELLDNVASNGLRSPALKVRGAGPGGRLCLFCGCHSLKQRDSTGLQSEGRHIPGLGGCVVISAAGDIECADGTSLRGSATMVRRRGPSYRNTMPSSLPFRNISGRGASGDVRSLSNFRTKTLQYQTPQCRLMATSMSSYTRVPDQRLALALCHISARGEV